MYIVTYNDPQVRVGDWWPSGCHVLDTMEEAKDFVTFMYETGGYEDIRVWDASEIGHDVKIKATVTIEE